MKICFPNPLRLTSGIVLASVLLVPIALAAIPQSSAPATPTFSAPALVGGVKAVKLKPGAENNRVITQHDSEHNLIAITKVETTGSVTTTFP